MDAIKSLLSDEGVEWYSKDNEGEGLLKLAIEFLARKKDGETFSADMENQEVSAIYRFLILNELENSNYGVKILIKKLENRMNLNHQFTLLKRKEWIKLPDKPFDFATFNHISTINKEAVQAKFVLQDLGGISGFLKLNVSSGDAFLNRVKNILYHLQVLEKKLPYWSLYLGKIQIQHLVALGLERVLAAFRNRCLRY